MKRRHFVMGPSPPGLGRADLSQANALAARLLKGAGVIQPEVYYLSDFQRRSWANVDFTALPAGERALSLSIARRRIAWKSRHPRRDDQPGSGHCGRYRDA